VRRVILGRTMKENQGGGDHKGGTTKDDQRGTTKDGQGGESTKDGQGGESTKKSQRRDHEGAREEGPPKKAKEQGPPKKAREEGPPKRKVLLLSRRRDEESKRVRSRTSVKFFQTPSSHGCTLSKHSDQLDITKYCNSSNYLSIFIYRRSLLRPSCILTSYL
jgi:hypothetical protein